MDFQLNVLDFEKIFNSIDTNETLSIVFLEDSSPEHKQLMVIDKTQDEIRLEEMDTHNITIWKRDEFVSNKYNILDIIRSQQSEEIPEAVFKASFESLEPQFVNYESVYIQKNDYEQIFPIQDQISAIKQYYLSRIEKPSGYARSIIEKKAEVLGSFIQNYNHIPKSTDIPLLDQINNNHFYSPFLRPIIYDSKYIFRESRMFDMEDIRNYFRDDEDKLIITMVDEITKENSKKDNIRLTYVDFQKVLIYGGELPFAIRIGDKSNIRHVDPLMSSYLPMNQVPQQKAADAAEGAAASAKAEALEKIKKVAGFSTNVSDFTDVYRFITPSYPFGPENKIQTSIRRTQGSKIILYDRPDNTEIGTNSGSRECFGTAGTAESKYYSKDDKYVPISGDNIYSSFNKCISKEPNEIRATDGEVVFIVGMFVKSPFSIIPPNNVLYKKKNNSLLPVDYFIENRNGWWNVIDRVIQSRSVQRKNKLNEITASDKPDYRNDNVILFEKDSFRDLSPEEFQEKLKQIIPSTQQILQIEEESLTNINNITDLNKILSKYFLSHKNLNIKQMTEMELFLRNSYNNLKKNVEQEKMDATHYNNLNVHCEQLFNDVYESICRFQNQRNLDERDVYNLIETYFKSFDPQHLSHILRFYYGLESAYLDEKKKLNIFVHLFSKRYTDYMQSESPVRLLLLPNFYIQDTIIQKYTDFIRRYYNFDIMSHAPSSIGLINELYHRMFIKDSSSYFNCFADFVYATNGYNKLVQDEQELSASYQNKDIVQHQIAELSKTILQEKIAFQIQQTACSNYQLSKFYSSVIDLMKDNNKPDVLVDKIFDKTATLNSIFMLHGKDSIPFIKEAYPHEPEDWYEVILNMLIDKNGKLNGALVEDEMWALLVEGDRYDLYQRKNKVWEYRMTVPELARVEVPYNKKTKQFSPPKNIAALCNLEGRDASVVEKIADFLYFGLKESTQPAENEINLAGKCVAYENACLPRIIMQFNKQLVELKSILKAFTYYEKQKQIYASTAFELRQKMEILLNQYESNEQAKIAAAESGLAIVRRALPDQEEIVNPVYQVYKKQWDLIVQISEIDVRYDEINKFIQLHGLLEKRVDPLNNSLVDAKNDGEWTHVYYDKMAENPEILCCRHYLVMVKQAWQGNEIRFKLQETLENLFRSDTSDEAAIFCKYCGEPIGNIKESEFEGFDDSEHVIRLREAVYEQSDDNLKLMFKDTQAEMYDRILVELMQTLQFKLKTQDITDVIRDATDIYFKSKLNIYTFEFRFVYQKMKTDSPYRKLRDTISKGELLPEDLQKNAQFKTLFDRDVFSLYNRYVAKLMVDTVMFQLMVHMLSMDPEIKMYPTGSRFSECRISVINNFILNTKAFFSMFAQVLFCIAKAANKPDDIFFIYKGYYGAGFKQEKIVEIQADFEKKFNDLLEKDTIFKLSFLKKKEKYEKQLEITKQLVLDSAVWKSFRPILKLGNPDTELSKINLASIDSTISDLTVLSDVEVQYNAFQLSNYLFYSIQKVIQERTSLMVGQSFSNYCCLEPLRTHYLEYFIRQDPRIQECIELMRRLEPRSFYNPNQSSWLICAGKGPNDIVIENTCPPLLDYFEEARRELNTTQLKQRILKLFQTYRLEDGADSGQRRLYSQYYDEYLAMVQVASPEEIKQTIQKDHPEMDETDVEQRVQNLYALIDPGLIRKDVETDQYSWTITKLANDLIAANAQDLLGLYDNLVLKLNRSSKLKISQHPYAPLTLQSSYADDPEQKTENFKELKLTFNKLVGAIHECGGDTLFAEILQLNDNLQKESAADADKINKLFEIIANVQFTKIEMQNPKVYFDFKEDLGNCTEIMEEKRRNLASYIQIEGYADEQIDEQKHIRDAILNKEDEFKILENLKQYYLFVIESISKFVNYRLNELTYGNGKIMFSANRHKELSENVNQSRIMNFKFNKQKFIDYVAINPEYNRLTGPQLRNMNKFVPIEYVQNLFMIIGDEAEILNPQYLKLIIYYLLNKTLTNFIISGEEHHGFVSNYVQIFIIDELKLISRFNCLSEKQVKTHLRDIIKKQNARRKKKVDDINKDESMRIQYNLIRSFGLGNVLEMKDTEEIATGLNDVADAGEVVENVQQGDEGGAPDDISAGGMGTDPRAHELQIGTRINRDLEHEEGDADAMGDEGFDYGA